MDPAIRQALTWATLCIAVVLSLFTWADISSGAASTAMWLNAVAWPVVVVIMGWVLYKNPYRSPDRED